MNPLGNSGYLAYNADSQVTQQVDADGRAINDTYDPGGRLTSEIWLGANGSQTDALTYTFDHADNLTVAGDNYGSYTFTLDSANRATRQVDPFNLTLNFTQDHNGNVTQVSDSAGGTETSVFDGDNQLTSRRLSGGPNNAQLRLDVTYTPTGLLSTLKRYAETQGTQFLGQTQDTYDPASALTEVKHTNAASTVLEDFTYQYDAGYRLSSETDTINGTPATTNYGYDVSNQLTSANGTNYNWTLNGNQNNAGDQVSGGNQLTSDGTWNYKYDPAGNVIEKDGVAGGPQAGVRWVYGFDNLNHLVSATQYVNGVLQVQETDFYDVYGNRIELDVTQGGITTTTKFAYNEVSGNGNIWADLNSSNQVQTRREYLDSLNAVFARLGSTGTEDWYLTDHLGSVRGLMNNSGTTDDTLTYNAWGSITNESTPTNGDREKNDGYQYDATTGMYYVMARWYDPVAIHWVSPDPLGFGAGDTNLYRDEGNGPTNGTDPTGLILVITALSEKILDPPN
jgi:RHS repeat-associated protein